MRDSAKWLQLKRMVGLNPTIPVPSQEGQIRYVRDGAVDGTFYFGRRLSTGVYEWQIIATGTASAACRTRRSS